MGVVYQARDPRIGRSVAIKVLPVAVSTDPDRLRRFEQEARAAGVLNHPNVTIVYDVGHHDGVPYVVEELLEGQTLREELGEGPVPSRKAVRYAAQIAEGLAAAHDKGIIHRDLKPENLFVTRGDRVKILDFGLAKLTEVESSAGETELPTATEAGVVIGTVGYMSPEQIKTASVDGRSDIFALGVVMYEMLGGQRPFQGSSAAETMAAILKEDPPDLGASNQDIHPALEQLVRHCLEKDPGRRFQSARDLAYQLETFAGISDGATAMRTPSPPRRMWRGPLLIAAVLIGIGILADRGFDAIRPMRSAPSYKRLTFRRGSVVKARFAPDGQTVLYSASWEGQAFGIFATRAGSLESRRLQLPDARLLAVSSTGELAISIGRASTWWSLGTLARVPLEGGAPRELLANVLQADWSADGRDLAVVHNVGDKYLLEFPIGKVVYETAQPIYSMRVSPRGDLMAVSLGTETVATVDRSGKVTALSTGWDDIENVAWRPDGEEVWFAGRRPAEQKHQLYAVTLSGRERVVRAEAGGFFFFDVSRDGRVLFNTYFYNQSLVVPTPGESSERELSWMDRAKVDGISKDGRFVVFDEWGEGGSDSGAIYLRATDGSPAVRLGDGTAMGLSPDGHSVLSQARQPSGNFVLLPTGAGQARPLEHIGITSVQWVGWGGFLPDGKRLFFLGRAGAGSWRLYVQSLDHGEPQPISSEGQQFGPVAAAPDGRFVAGQGPDSKIALYPIDGGASRPLPGAEAGESPILWSADGESLYVYRTNEAPARVFKVDITTGRRQLWKTIAPADRSGLITIDNIVMTPDAQSLAYSYTRILTSLQLAEGLR